MTVSDVPLASANHGGQVDSPSVRARARARLAATLRDVKVLRRPRRTLVSDLRRAWWVVVRPPSLGEWWQSLRPDPLAVPAGSPLIRWAWIADSYTTGLILAGLSIMFHVAGSATRWAAKHPLRRWALITTVAATVAALVAF